MPEDILDDGQSVNDQGDYTPEEKEDLFNEDDDTEVELDEDKEEEEKKKVDKSEVAQKIKYREKFLKAQDKIKTLEDKVKSQEQKGESTELEQKELAAQKYIRKQAREEYEAIKAEEIAKEEAVLEKFQAQLDAVLEANPDFTEEQLVEICEDYKVEPEIAVKILKKSEEKKSAKKPSLPSSKRATPKVNSEDTEPDDKSKSMWDIAQEIKKSLKRTK